MLARSPRPLPHPFFLVLGAIVSVQVGAAVAAGLIRGIGAPPTVALRLVAASVVLLAVARPSLRGHSRRDWLGVVALGVLLAAMNLTFYSAIAFLPLGVVVTIELIGPLTLASLGSRRPRDLVAVAVALAGVLATSGVLGARIGDLDFRGVGFSLAAAVAWSSYIVGARSVGRRWRQLDGLAIAMPVAAAIVVPIAAVTTPDLRLTSDMLVAGVAVGLLSSVIPYSLELVALRRIDTRVFGILVSLEPAVAEIAALVVIGESLTPLEVAGMGLVVVASALVMIDQRATPEVEAAEIA